jgi:hypothetical protein
MASRSLTYSRAVKGAATRGARLDAMDTMAAVREAVERADEGKEEVVEVEVAVERVREVECVVLVDD